MRSIPEATRRLRKLFFATYCIYMQLYNYLLLHSYYDIILGYGDYQESLPVSARLSARHEGTSDSYYRRDNHR